MLKILNRLRGKSISDIFLRFLKEIFILYNNLFNDKAPLKFTLNENSLLLTKKVSHNFPKISSYPFFDTCNESEIIDWANNIRSHEFNLLGSDNVKVSYENMSLTFEGVSHQIQPNKPNLFCSSDVYKPIDWHCDFKSGYRWSNKDTYNKVRKKSDGVKGVDIKVPWELSRFQHLSVLIKAYELTKDKLYLDEVILQITDWILNNKSYKGANWTCTMDVSIRLANWSIALDYIEKFYEIPKNIKKIFLTSFKDHIKYIMFNLEWTNRLTSNHYLSDISGLYVALLYFDKYKFLKRWSKNQLEKEIFKQSYSDGMNSESSTKYHRLVLELFTFPLLFAKKDFSQKYLDRVEKMFEFIFWIRKNDGSVPIFGDNDSGLFFYYSSRQKNDLTYFDKLYEDIYNRKIDFKKYQGIKIFKESGITLYKKDKIHLAIANMPNGQNGNGGHCHNDKLSFELTIADKPVFVDPGTYVYTPLPISRNQYRATSSHNTVSVENSEQNRFIKNNLFSFSHDVDTITNKLDHVSEDMFRYSGTHNGYQRDGNDYVHERKFEVTNNNITIYDEIVSEHNNINCFATFLIPKKYFKQVVGNKVISELINIKFSSNDINYTEDIRFANEYGELKEQLITIKVNFKDHLESKIIVNE